MEYEVTKDRQTPGTPVYGGWRVEAIDYESDGQVYVAIFSGPGAEARAREYAAIKNYEPDAEAAAGPSTADREAWRKWASNVILTTPVSIIGTAGEPDDYAGAKFVAAIIDEAAQAPDLQAEVERLEDEITTCPAVGYHMQPVEAQRKQRTMLRRLLETVTGERDALRQAAQIRVDAEDMTIEDFSRKWKRLADKYMDDGGTSLHRAALEAKQ